MRYKIVKRILQDKEGNDLEIKWAVKKKFLKYFWRTIYTADIQSLAQKHVDIALKDEAKRKCKWVEEDTDLVKADKYTPHKVMARRKKRN